MSGSTVGSIVGGGIGALVGGPAGFKVGWMIGGTLGGVIHPDQIKGPRLSDGQTVTSQEGIPIPFGFGTFPVGGNIIWADVLVEHAQKEGGKGGPQTTSYTYSRSYAVGICEGEITAIQKAWRNGKLVYDISPNSAILGQNSKFLENHKFYTGSETQTVDPTIEAVVGVGNSPPMKGLAYMVSENEDLTESGGAVAQWRFVVQMCGTLTPMTAPAEPTLIIGNAEWIGLPDSLQTASGMAPSLSSGGPPQVQATSRDGRVLAHNSVDNNLHIHRWNGTAYVAQTISGGTPGITVNAVSGLCITNDGEFVLVASLDNSETYVYQFDGVSDYALVTTEAFGQPARAICFSPDGTQVAVTGGGGGGYYTIVYNFNASTGALAVSATSTNTSTLRRFVDWFGNRIVVSGGAAARVLDASSLAELYVGPGSSSAAAFFDSTGLFIYQGSAIYDSTLTLVGSGSVIGTGFTSAHISKDRKYLLLLQPTTASTLFAANGGVLAPITATAIPHASSADGAVFTGFGPAAAWYVVPDAPNTYADEDGNLITDYVVGDEVSACGADLADIIGALCERASVEPAEYDVTPLSGTFVTGYPCATESSAQGFIEPLTQGFFFDRGEWDKKLRFIPRGGMSVAALDTDDLVSMNGPAVVQTRVQEVELLRKVNVMTVDPEAEFNATKQSAERRIGTIQATGESTVEIPIVCDADTAAQIADKRLKVAWAETDKFSYGVTLAQAALTPTDVVTLTDKAGIAHRIRLQAQAEEGGAITIEEAMKDRASTYGSTATGVQNPNLPVGSDVQLVGPTKFAAMALPMLRSQDNTPGLYIGMCGILDGWAGAQLLMSVDGGVSYTVVLSVTEPTIMGELTADEDSNGEPIQVRVFGGTLESATTAQVDTGKNWSGIETDGVAEIIAYETATPTGDKTYDLTDTTRALDETVYASHYAADPFMDLSTAYYLPISAGPGMLYFKAVGFGVSSDAVDPVAVEWAGVSYVHDGGEVTP